MKLVFKNQLDETVSLQIRPEDTFADLNEIIENEIGILLDLDNIATNEKRVIDTIKVAKCIVDVQCAVPCCNNSKITTPNKVFFDFPQLPHEEIKFHQWVLYCQRLSMASGKHRLNLTQDSVICSDHFRIHQFIKDSTTLLKRTAFPCINPELVEVGEFTPCILPKLTPSISTPQVVNSLYCRLCGNKTFDFIYIYSPEGKKQRLADKINSCLPIKIEMTDSLPKQVCKTCVQDLENLFNFGQVSCNADEELKNVSFKSEEMKKCPLCEEGHFCSKNDEFDPDKKQNYDELQSILEEYLSNLTETELDDDSLPCEESGSFMCSICGQESVELSDFVKHSASHASVHHCPNCKNYFDSIEDLETHVASIHKSEPEEVQIQCKTCKATFKSFILLAMHGCESSLRILSNKCNICHKTFGSKARLQFHMKFHSGASPGYCTLCKKTFPDEVNLYNHTVYLHSSGTNHNCNDSSKIFRSMSTLKSHQRTHTREDINKSFVCELCYEGFESKTVLQGHISSQHTIISEYTIGFTCKICCEAFPSTYVVEAHMDAKHKKECIDELCCFEMHSINRVFACEYCERCFAEGSTLNKHREIHATEIPYECKYCSETFSSFGEHKEHKSTHVDRDIPLEYNVHFSIPLNYLCKYCDRCFMNYIKFSEHLTVHYHPEPYQCRICLARFKTLEDATKHRSTHPEYSTIEEYKHDRPFDCHYCNKSFAFQTALGKHIRTHTGEKPFICGQCGKGFSQNSGLYRHENLHSNVRPYDCPICPRLFKIKEQRDVHVRKHSGDRPYKCEFCDKAFMTQAAYIQHRKMHTGQRPYKCNVCGVAFKRSSVLTVHQLIHTGEKPNICDVCGKRYRQRKDLLKHRRIQHALHQ